MCFVLILLTKIRFSQSLNHQEGNLKVWFLIKSGCYILPNPSTSLIWPIVFKNSNQPTQWHQLNIKMQFLKLSTYVDVILTKRGLLCKGTRITGGIFWRNVEKGASQIKWPLWSNEILKLLFIKPSEAESFTIFENHVYSH